MVGRSEVCALVGELWRYVRVISFVFYLKINNIFIIVMYVEEKFKIKCAILLSATGVYLHLY